MDVAGKVAIVTGAATGIGHAIAEGFASAEAMVVMGDVDATEGRKVASTLDDGTGKVIFQEADVSDPGSARGLVEEAVSRFGALDVLVNNAAIQIEKTIEDLEPDEWDRLIDVNMKGVYLCSKFAIPRMRERGGGAIINIASVNGFWVEPQLGAYCASKGGVIALTRSTAADFGRDGIRCNCICPGFIDTGMAGRYIASLPDPAAARAQVASQQAVGRMGLPADIANMAQFLASDAAGFATGGVYVVDGGMTLGVVAQEAEAAESPVAAN